MRTDASATLVGITSFTTYRAGQMRECKVNMPNLVLTRYGRFVPQYSNPGIRRKDAKSLAFFEDGSLRALSLENETPIETSVGIIMAELVTFFEDGSLDSLFPLDGQISFAWSEEEEADQTRPYAFSFSFAAFQSKIIGIRFFPNGLPRSLILWPNEVIMIKTAVDEIPSRIGFCLYEDGKLASIEPAEPVQIRTPIGIVFAFDTTALGVDADINSLAFDRKGRVKSLALLGTLKAIHIKTGKTSIYVPAQRIGLTDDAYADVPIRLSFETDVVTVASNAGVEKLTISDYLFENIYLDHGKGLTCEGNCSNCSGCK